MTTPADELPQEPTGTGFDDAITYSWGDADAQLFGLARMGLSPGATSPEAAGYALLFAGHEAVAVRAAGGRPAEAGAGWDAVDVAGVHTHEHAPLQAWDVHFTGDDGSSGFALRFAALSPPGSLPADAPAAVAGGLQGYEQLCRVTGFATVNGEPRAVDCLGQRGHSWGTPDPERFALVRSVSAWLHEELALAVTAVRPRRAKSHADEVVAASLFTSLDEDGTIAAVAIGEARLSTTTDAEGRLRRAGIEVFLDEDDPGHRAAGEVLCGMSLDLGRLRLDCAFFAWHMEGHTGVGRYDVLRHVA